MNFVKSKYRYIILMKSLLIVAHGSRREASNNEVRALTEHIKTLPSPYSWIECAFLELADPLIPDGIRLAIQAGASEVTVLPYFLSAGRHVVKDIPRDVAMVQTEYPDIPIIQAPYLGSSNAIAEILLNQAL